MAANTGNTTLNTDLNVYPYYDDYEENKQFYRILYKPGYAVQARELTQSQTILQKQVDRIGKHLFKEGSIVVPGSFTLNTKDSIYGPIQYVKVRDVDTSNTAVTIENYLNETITGDTTGITAEIGFVLDGSESSSNTKTIYVDYTSGSNSNAAIKTFQAGEILSCNAGTLYVLNTNPTGTASAFRISEGAFFAKEHVIAFDTQSTILDRYNPTPNVKIGFLINESIVSSSDDSSLLDPALESSNYSAPGADRLKLNPILSVRPYDDPIGAPDFVTLMTVENGIIVTNNERSQYNILADEMAKRTFDESGHYYVEGLNINLREHLDDGTNGGRRALANGGNSELISVQISPGVAYVSGYEIEFLTTSYITTPKATTYKTVNEQLASAAMGHYVTVNEMTGNWVHNTGVQIELYDEAMNRLSDNKWSTAAQTGNNIGSAKLLAVAYNSGTMGTPEGKFDVYLTDIQMTGSNNFSNVKSIYRNNSGTSDIGADIVLNTSNAAVLQDATLNPMLYYIGSDYVKTIKPNNVSDTTFTYKVSTDVADISGGTWSLTLPSGADLFPYGTSSLSDSQRRELIVAINGDSNVAMSGTVSNNGTEIVGLGTNFTLLNVGDKISITGVGGIYRIDSITNATSMTVNTALTVTASGAAFEKTYKNGDILDLTLIGAAAGVERSVSATSTQLNFDIKEILGTTTPATVTYRVSSTQSIQINKTLRPQRYVKINVDSHSTGTSGPYSVGFSDLYKIRQIRLDTSTFSSNTQGSNVTAQFIVDNGQRDTYYDHAKITPKSPLAAGSHLLVELDYFDPDFTTGQGFFSIDSYPIDDGNTSTTTIKTAEIPIYKSLTTGAEYDLRNYLDFRPVKTNSSTDASTVGTASENPGTSSTFDQDANGLRIPAPYSQISYDYEFYLARKDVVTLNKDKQWNIVRGVPAAVPITPTVSDTVMALGTITVAPYPSLSLYYANQINRRDLACSTRRTASVRFTMRDIGVLKDRIINLEYYAALSLLEKNALDLKILDANGLDRFKNGIFCDTFTSHALGATYSPDYRIVVDPEEKSIRPLYTMESVGYRYVSGSNVTKTGDLVTLSYSEVPFITLNNATTTRNTERTTWRYHGFMTLNPSDDIWVDTSVAPDLAVQFNLNDAFESNVVPIGVDAGGISTEWNSWQQYVTGYRVYRGNEATENSLAGQFNTIQEAQSFASLLRNDTSVTIETLRASERSGVERWSVTDIQTQSLGSRVINTELASYIRPQTIKVLVRQLKPYARYYTFFDRTNMSDYVTPLTEAEYNSNTQFFLASSEGDELIATANGEVRFNLRLPNDSGLRFYTGTKEVKVTDSPTNDAEDETSFASGQFVSKGLIQETQQTSLSTRQVINRDRTIGANRTDPSAFVNLARIPPPPPEPPWEPAQEFSADSSCAAYSFQVKTPQNEEGVFITSVDVFIAEKHPEKDIWFEIMEVDETGRINNNQVPFSAVWFDNQQVVLSEDGVTNPLNVKFPAPVFLQNNKFYAFIIHPEALNPNYYFWVSRLGQNDVNSGQPVNSRLYTGRFYTTNNGIIWDFVPDIDLTMKVYRASFTDSTGTITLGNNPIEIFRLGNTSASITNIGRNWYGGDRLTLSSITGGTISETDLIIGANSAVNSAVVRIDTTYNMANTGYESGESVNVSFANGTTKGVTATISGIDTRGFATVSRAKESSSEVRVKFENSTGQFVANDRIFAADGTYGEIVAIDNFRYSVVDFEPSYLLFSRTTLDWEMKTYSNAGVEGSFTEINPNENYYFDTERAIFSRSNEVQNFSGANTNIVQGRLTSSSTYLSPVIDLARTHAIFIDNIVNSNTLNETNASGGYLYNKYISKIITLAEGQDAEDMQLWLTAYRPPGTDVKVWVKILHAEDADTIAVRPWIELEKQKAQSYGTSHAESPDTIYSSLSDRNDFIEYQYGFSAANLTGSFEEVQYRNTANTATFTGFKNFSVKIGLTADNSAIVPRVADLRTVCLQK